jgi:hypothetical protein
MGHNQPNKKRYWATASLQGNIDLVILINSLLNDEIEKKINIKKEHNKTT